MARTKQVSDAEVLSQALGVIHERGPDRFTLADVGDAVGLSPATLIQRFGSKERLVQGAVAQATAELEESLARSRPPGTHPRRELIGWLVELARDMDTRERVAGHLDVLRRDLLEPEMAALAQRHAELIQGRIEEHLRAMDPVPATDARMVQAHWQGLVLQWSLSGEGPLDAWLEEGLEALLELGGGDRDS